jgi:Transcriptional regulatory protein, C terminal
MTDAEWQVIAPYLASPTGVSASLCKCIGPQAAHRHAPFKHDGELVHGTAPCADGHRPLLPAGAQCYVEPLVDRCIARQPGAMLDDLAHGHLQRLTGGGRRAGTPDLARIAKHWRDARPTGPPRADQQGGARAPLGLTLRQVPFCRRTRRRLVHVLQRERDSLTVLIRNVAQGVAHELDETELNLRGRNDRCKRFGKARHASHTGDKEILDAAMFAFRNDWSPAFGARALRRPPAQPVLRVADLEVNTITHEVRRAGKQIDLTSKEYALLEYFLRNPNRVLTRAQIAEHVWDYDFIAMSNVVDVYVRYLRRKLDDDYEPRLLRTVRGTGYQLSVPRS